MRQDEVLVEDEDPIKPERGKKETKIIRYANGPNKMVVD